MIAAADEVKIAASKLRRRRPERESEEVEDWCAIGAAPPVLCASMDRARAFQSLTYGTAAIYRFGYTAGMRPVRFLGSSLKCLREFPEDARHDAGYQLEKVQRGGQPDDSNRCRRSAKVLKRFA